MLYEDEARHTCLHLGIILLVYNNHKSEELTDRNT